MCPLLFGPLPLAGAVKSNKRINVDIKAFAPDF